MHVFTYGTLQVKEIWTRVAGAPCERIAGVVLDHAVLRVRNEDYPGMTPTPGVEASGLVYLDVDWAMIERLDRFEGDQYRRRPVEARCVDGLLRQCEAYLVADDLLGLLTTEAWSLEAFITGGGLARFSRRYIGFATLEQ